MYMYFLYMGIALYCIIFDTTRYKRRCETVQRLGDFQSKQCQLYKDPNNVSVEKTMSKKEKMYVKII